ncbi:MAG: HU family DNA-binding protein [Clostridia bacterium]
MNKTDLTAAIAEMTGLTKKDSDKACTAFVDAVTGALVKGDKVSIVGFGTFEVRVRAAREGINPATKQKIKIKAAKAPAFKPGKALKEKVNK